MAAAGLKSKLRRLKAMLHRLKAMQHRLKAMLHRLMIKAMLCRLKVMLRRLKAMLRMPLPPCCTGWVDAQSESCVLPKHNTAPSSPERYMHKPGCVSRITLRIRCKLPDIAVVDPKLCHMRKTVQQTFA